MIGFAQGLPQITGSEYVLNDQVVSRAPETTIGGCLPFTVEDESTYLR